MKKFFKDFGLSLCFLVVFLLNFVFLVVLDLLGLAPDQHLVSEFEALCVGYGFLHGLLWSSFFGFIVYFISDFMDFSKSKFFNRNHSSNNEDVNK